MTDHSICANVAGSSTHQRMKPITAEKQICSTLKTSGSDFFVNSAATTVYNDIRTQAPSMKTGPDESPPVSTTPFDTKSPAKITIIPATLFLVGNFLKTKRIRGTITILRDARKLAVEEGI